MPIFVKTLTRKTITLNISASDTIEIVSNYTIQEESTVHLTIQPLEQLSMTCTLSETANPVVVEVLPDTTVSTITVELLVREAQIEPNRQKLFCNGELLEDVRTLTSCDLNSQSHIFLCKFLKVFYVKP